MKHTHLVFAGALLGGLACAPDARSPLSAAFEPETPAAAVGLARASTSETHAERLTAVTGAGAGIVNVTPTAADDGTFAAQIEVNAHGLPPETTFSVERSPDLVPDGVCTNPAWVPFGVTFTTSAGGAGAAHIDFHRGAPFLSGVSFDVRFRVVGPGAELQTGCFTVTVK